MLNPDHINLTEAQPALNDWLVRCHIFECLETAALACADLETLTSLRRVPLSQLAQPGKLLTRSLAEVSDDGEHILITPVGISFYNALQAWLTTWRQQNIPQEGASA